MQTFNFNSLDSIFNVIEIHVDLNIINLDEFLSSYIFLEQMRDYHEGRVKLFCIIFPTIILFLFVLFYI